MKPMHQSPNAVTVHLQNWKHCALFSKLLYIHIFVKLVRTACIKINWDILIKAAIILRPFQDKQQLQSQHRTKFRNTTVQQFNIKEHGLLTTMQKSFRVKSYCTCLHFFLFLPGFARREQAQLQILGWVMLFGGMSAVHRTNRREGEKRLFREDAARSESI